MRLFRRGSPLILGVVAVAAFMAADKLVLHWYVPDTDAHEERIATLESYLSDVRSWNVITSLDQRVYDVEANIDEVRECLDDLEVETLNENRKYLYGYPASLLGCRVLTSQQYA